MVGHCRFGLAPVPEQKENRRATRPDETLVRSHRLAYLVSDVLAHKTLAVLQSQIVFGVFDA